MFSRLVLFVSHAVFSFDELPKVSGVGDFSKDAADFFNF